MSLLRILNRVCILFVPVICLSVNFSEANVLLNSGFEAGEGTDAADWEEFGGPAGSTTRDDSMPNTGSFAAYMAADHINNSPAAVPYFIQQTLPVGSIDNSLNYDLSFSAKVDSTDFEGVDMFYQIQWLDQDASDGGGVKGETLTPLTTAGISTSYQQFSLNDIDVPDGADSVLLRFQVSPGPIPDIANGMYVDDATLTVVGGGGGVTGDFNENGIVDAADYTVWLKNLGGSESTIGDLGDDNGTVDQGDYNLWKTGFGNSGSLTGTAQVAIPEPASLVLFLGVALVALTQFQYRLDR